MAAQNTVGAVPSHCPSAPSAFVNNRSVFGQVNEHHHGPIATVGFAMSELNGVQVLVTGATSGLGAAMAAALAEAGLGDGHQPPPGPG